MRFKFYIFKLFFILDFRVDVRLKYDISLDEMINCYVSIIGIKVRIDIKVSFDNLNYLKFFLLRGYKVNNIIKGVLWLFIFLVSWIIIFLGSV